MRRYKSISKNGRVKFEHVWIAEGVIGKGMPIGALVHHVDGDGFNNARTNLVICPSQAYHKLIHLRTDALAACGNPDWRKCRVCKKYDDLENLVVKQRRNGIRVIYHKLCAREEERARRAAGRPEGWAWVPGSQNVGRRNAGHLEKLRLIHTGRKRSPETRERMRQSALRREAAKRAAP